MFCGSRSRLSVALFVQHLTDNVCIHDSGSSVCTMWTVRRRGKFSCSTVIDLFGNTFNVSSDQNQQAFTATFKKNLHKYSFKSIPGNLAVHISLYILYTSV